MTISPVQLAVSALLMLHVLQLLAYPQVMNLRSSVAVCVFLMVAAFAERRGSNRYAIGGLEILGIGGAGAVMIVIHFNA